MQVGRVMFILDEEKSTELLNVLDFMLNGFYDEIDRDNVQELYADLNDARKIVFIDDIRKEKIDILPD